MDVRTFTIAFGALIIGLPAIALAQAPRTFDSAEAAAQALIDATEKDDVAALSALFGPGGKAVLTSGDAEQDKKERAEFARLARDKHQLEPDPLNSAVTILAIGSEDWPFPVPIARSKDKWYFDASQGAVEMRARRVGANELEYAKRIAGAQGQPDSLYWGGGAEPLVPKAFADAAVETGKAAEVKPKPYHGYYFRVLQAQGPNAEGGRHNYMVKDSMIGGFGLVAWPAHYGVSGVHTFIVNQNGVIYEKDLGNPTTSLSTTVTSYDPDKSWTRVQ
jgi:hypothetical protein